MHRIFLLSPARCSGKRASILLNEKATFPLAVRLRTEGAAIGEVFSFLSGLYFRGKLTYATRFAKPTRGIHGVLVITPNQGLVPASHRLSVTDMHGLAEVPIDLQDARYRAPLARDSQVLADDAGQACEAVLLGSIATGKYHEVLHEFFADRLKFPTDFVGRGDMSRGGLLLRAARDGQELAYSTLAGAVKKGCRPPRLEKIPGIMKVDHSE